MLTVSSMICTTENCAMVRCIFSAHARLYDEGIKLGLMKPCQRRLLLPCKEGPCCWVR